MNMLSRFGCKVPVAFSYGSTRMILASLSSLILTIVLGNLFIRRLQAFKVGHVVRVSDVPGLFEQYGKSREIPSMGGILILTTILMSSFMWMDFTNAFTYILIFTLVWMGCIGCVDDYMKMRSEKGVGLKPMRKLGLQALFSVMLSAYIFCAPCTNFMSKMSCLHAPVAREVVSSGHVVKSLTISDYSGFYYIPFFKKPIVLSGIGLIVAAIFTVIVITGSANAVNLTDGLDGLAAGLVLLVAAAFGIISFLSSNILISSYLNILYVDGAGEIGVFLCALIGSCLGFLWFNGHPAQVFMGDTGSLALGGILGVVSVLLRREFLLAIVGGIFVVEALSVLLQVASFKFRNGKRVFLCAPLHHHFQMKGWHEAKVVIRFWMIGLILTLLGLASLKIQ